MKTEYIMMFLLPENFNPVSTGNNFLNTIKYLLQKVGTRYSRMVFTEWQNFLSAHDYETPVNVFKDDGFLKVNWVIEQLGIF